MTTTTEITAESKMGAVLEAFPGAQRALMRRYHIGGCSSCGFAPEDRLGEVLAKHNVLAVGDVIEYIKTSHAEEQRIQIQPQDLAEALKSPTPPRLLDVREPEELAIVKLDGAVPVTQELVQEMMAGWPKDTPIVTYCHHGIRSLEAASYLIGHGFTDVRTLVGGIDAWAEQIDPSLPRY